MVIHTRSEKVVDARENVLEILLANHPLDCPVCDKGGECELQDTVFEYGKGDSRFFDSKRVFRTCDIELNNVIVFNANRCIQCQRCVRVCEDVVGDVALGTGERGLDSEITGVGNSLKDCSHCGNCIEVCPVGALMSTPYRYKARPWDLIETETICAMCGTGCSLTAQTRGGNLVRVKSKYETGLNGELLCAKGRFGLDFIDGGERVTEPMIRKNGKLEVVSWNEAISFIAASAKNIIENGGYINGQISPRQTNETAYIFQKLMREVFRSESISSSGRFAGLNTKDPRLAPALVDVMARYYTREPFGDILKADCILALGSNITDENPVSGYLTRTALKEHGNKLFIASSRPSGLDNVAKKVLRLLPGSEGSLLAALLTGERGLGGFETEFIDSVRTEITNSESISILVGTEFLRTQNATNCLENIGQAATYFKSAGKNVSIQFLFDRPNQLGIWDMGCLAGLSAGWRASETGSHPNISPGMTYVLGADPVGTWHSNETLSKVNNSASILVAHCAFFGNTAEQATVLLPAPSYGEERGSFTNNEGRVQQLSSIRPANSSIRSTIDVLNSITREMGHAVSLETPEDVFSMIIGSVEGYKTLDQNSGNDFGFTSYILDEPNQSSKKTLLAMLPQARKGSHFLLTGDDKFTSGKISTNSKILTSLGNGQYAQMNFEVKNGDDDFLHEAAISYNGATIVVPLKLNRSFAEGVIYVPETILNFHSNKLFRNSEYPPIVDVQIKKS